MSNTKSIGITVLLAAGVALIVSYFGSSDSVIREVIHEVSDGKLGATPGQDFQSDLSIGGVGFRYERQRFTQATTTVCHIISPTATSTLESMTVAWNNADSVATTSAAGSGNPLLVIARQLDGNLGTTTAIDSVIQLFPNFSPTSNGAVGGQFKAINASTTQDGINTNELFPPKSALNVKISNSYAGDYRGYAPDGSCTAIFKAL